MITNKPNVSQAWVLCAEDNGYDKVGDYSATEIVAPVRLQTLLKRHKDEIVQDVSDMVWMMLGSAMHWVLEQAKMTGVFTEDRFMIPFDGWNLSMKPDRVEPIPDTDGEYKLIDIKTASRYTIKHGPKDDWKRQLNIYAFGLMSRGFKVTQAAVECLIKDWSWTDCNVKRLPNYPQYPLLSLPIELWEPEITERYIRGRLQLFADAVTLSDADLPDCTVEERWATDDSYAVVYSDGKGKGRAVRGGAELQTKAAAQGVLKKQERKCHIEYRKGESIRCERYCPVRNWCNQYKKKIRKNPF